MAVHIYPPFELENLLPYDISYRIFDKASRIDFGGNLKTGKVIPFHTADISHLLGITIEIRETGITNIKY